MSQSAQWPLHRWLLSSLNSPTPVSALMHAGLVNGGGFLLVRFAPLYLHYPESLLGIFIIGFITTILGTFWKLIQSDVKRMLVCSTVAQMGFMFMQCGLGLFSAAVTHLCWHGLFKAYLFLSVSSVVHENRHLIKGRRSTASSFLLSILCGCAGAYRFILISNTPASSLNTQLFLIGFALLTGTQLAHVILEKNNKLFNLITAALIVFAGGCLYGWSIRLIELILLPMGINIPQPLNSLHVISFACIFLIWIVANSEDTADMKITDFWRRLYVSALNSSQSHKKTITANRKDYQY